MGDLIDLLAQVCAIPAHPNVLSYFTAYPVSTIHLDLVMEYADGGSLVEFLSKNTLDAGQTAKCMLGIALGLQHLHTCGHLHGSISPHRILVSTTALPTSGGTALSGAGTDLRCMLSGMCLEPTISSVRSEESRESQSSLVYYAPEIRSTTPKRSDKMDIWSCGVLFLWLLGALPPTISTGRRRKFERMDCSACPPRYRPLVESMVDLEPRERPGASDVVKALRSIE
jgi:serine/threonine protein kinase